MMNWIMAALAAQFIFALVVLIDRFVVSKKIVGHSLVYAFYVCLLSFFAVIALPFGVTMPSIFTMWISIAVSVSYLISIYLLYESLKNSKPSEVAPIVGGVSAIATFVISSWVLGTDLPPHFIAGFALLVIGMTLVSHFKITRQSFVYLTGSGIFFGLSAVLMKLIFEHDTFINGFFWSRMGNVFIALVLLVIPGISGIIRADWNHKNKSKKSFLVVGNKVLAGVAFLIVLYAIKHGDVSIVKALEAAQYVFLLIFAIFFGRLLPQFFEERTHKHEAVHKAAAIALILGGFFFLFV